MQSPLLPAFGAVSLLPTLLATPVPAVTNSLPPVIIEAARLESTAQDIPQSVHTYTAADVTAAEAGGFTGFLARKAPELDLHNLGGANPALAQISMRGWGENGFGRTLVLLDGERLDNADMNTPDLSRIPLGNVRQVEILAGPGTVLYGNGASAGIVNVLTDPEGYARHGHLELHGGSWNTIGGSLGYRDGSAETGTQGWANGSWEHSDGWRDNTGYDLYTASGGVKQNWANGSFLRVSAFHSDADYETPGALSRDQWHADPRQSFTPDDFYRRIASGLNVTASGVIDDENTLRLLGTLSRRHMRAASAGSQWEDRNEYRPWSFSLRPEWLNTSAWGTFDNELVSGAEFRYDRSHNRNEGISYGYPYADKYALERTSMAFFARDTFHFNDAWALQAGGRYERLWNDNTRNRTSSIDDLAAAETALLYTPTDDLKAYLRLTRSFRAPFLDEINYARGQLLDPETTLQADLGVDYAFLEDFHAAADIFCGRTEDEIFCYYNSQRGGLADNMNAPSETLRRGATLRAGWERRKFAALDAGVTWTQATFDGGEFDGKDIPLVAEVSAALNGRLWLRDDLSVFLGCRYRSEQWSAADFNNDGAGTGRANRIPDYIVFHTGAEYRPAFAPLEGLAFAFRVDNLFDRDYCDYATYGTAWYPAAGRGYTFTVRYEF